MRKGNYCHICQAVVIALRIVVFLKVCTHVRHGIRALTPCSRAIYIRFTFYIFILPILFEGKGVMLMFYFYLLWAFLGEDRFLLPFYTLFSC